jgi:hypothetical protein
MIFEILKPEAHLSLYGITHLVIQTVYVQSSLDFEKNNLLFSNMVLSLT